MLSAVVVYRLRIFLKCGRPLYSHQVRSDVKITITITAAATATTTTTTTTTTTVTTTTTATTKTDNVCSQVRIHRYQLLVCSVNNKKDRKTSTTQNNAING